MSVESFSFASDASADPDFLTGSPPPPAPRAGRGLVLKIELGGELRRCRVTDPRELTLRGLHGLVRHTFPAELSESEAPLRIAFRDADGDVCTIATDAGLADALAEALESRDRVLRLLVAGGAGAPTDGPSESATQAGTDLLSIGNMSSFASSAIPVPNPNLDSVPNPNPNPSADATGGMNPFESTNANAHPFESTNANARGDGADGEGHTGADGNEEPPAGQPTFPAFPQGRDGGLDACLDSGLRYAQELFARLSDRHDRRGHTRAQVADAVNTILSLLVVVLTQVVQTSAELLASPEAQSFLAGLRAAAASLFQALVEAVEGSADSNAVAAFLRSVGRQINAAFSEAQAQPTASNAPPASNDDDDFDRMYDDNAHTAANDDGEFDRMYDDDEGKEAELSGSKMGTVACPADAASETMKMSSSFASVVPEAVPVSCEENVLSPTAPPAALRGALRNLGASLGSLHGSASPPPPPPHREEQLLSPDDAYATSVAWQLSLLNGLVALEQRQLAGAMAVLGVDVPVGQEVAVDLSDYNEEQLTELHDYLEDAGAFRDTSPPRCDHRGDRRGHHRGDLRGHRGRRNGRGGRRCNRGGPSVISAEAYRSYDELPSEEAPAAPAPAPEQGMDPVTAAAAELAGMSRSAVRQALALERERMDPIAPTVATVPIAADALGAVDPEHAVTTAAAEDDNTAAGGDTEDIVIAEAIAEVEADAKAARAAAGGTVEEEGAVEAKATPALFDSAAAPPAPADATHAKADSDSDESSGSWVEVDSTAMDVALDVALDVEQTSPPAEAEPQEMPPPWESGDAPNPYPIEALYDAEVNMLVAMGFTETGARPALVRSKGDVTAAIEELLG